MPTTTAIIALLVPILGALGAYSLWRGYLFRAIGLLFLTACAALSAGTSLLEHQESPAAPGFRAQRL